MERKPIIPAIGAGVDLLFREPGAVLIWGLITTVVTVVPSALIMLIIGGEMMDIIAAGDTSAPPDPTAFLIAQPLQLLQYLGLLLVVAVIYPAIMRAVLFPDERRRAYIRLGSAELFFGLFVVVLYIAMIFAAIIGGIVMIVMVFAAAAAAPQGGAGALAAILVMLLGLIPVIVGFGYVFSRLWMAAPIIVATGQFKLLDGWTLTRGYGWRLTGMAILLGIISYLLQIFLTVIAAAIAAAIFGINFGAIFSGDMDALLNAAPSLIGAVLLGSAISVFIVTPVFIAPWARVYTILNGGAEPPAIVFD